jgi:serine phosphatase RsbU (regulator of sigma subunit)/anti-sigma regulatory factor (Ser/Thr protein kinase)
MCRHATRVLPPEPESAGVARRFLTDLCDQWGLSSLVDDAQLALTELVSNAVLHAATPVTVSISCGEDMLEISVFDGSPVMPVLRRVDELPGDDDGTRPHVQDAGESARGRGLLLVDALVAEWGISPQSDGKAVWARTPLPAGWEQPGGCPCRNPAGRESWPLASGAEVVVADETRRGVPGPVDFATLFDALPTPYLVMAADDDFTVLDANPAYLANVERTRAELVGQPVFEAFPPTPDALDENGVPRIQISFERARATKQQDTMPLQKYDIPDGAGGYTERFWSLISIPVMNAQGEVVLMLQRAENVSDFVRERERQESDTAALQLWERRVEEVQSDLYARSQELATALQAQEVTSRRLASLAEVVLQLAGAESVQDMADVLSAAGLPALAANGGAIAVRVPGTEVLELTVAAAAGPSGAHLPLDGPLPLSVAARGQEVLVPEIAAATSEQVVAELGQPGTRASAVLPLRVGNRLLGSLQVTWSTPHAFPPEEVELLRAFASQCAQVLDRLQVRQAEREAAAEVGRISETLQRSLLTEPPQTGPVQLAVHYQPASRVAQVGGDWYDAFAGVGDAMTLVIGDVAGHDRDAAAAMAQVRNLLRGVAVSSDGSPADVLARLDRAMGRLDLDVLATIVVAQVTPGVDATCRLRWCNAGHPPPVLLHADGSAELLSRSADLLCGLVADAERTDHEVVLQRGDTVLLFTDGLVETRAGDLSADLEGLRLQVARHSPGAGPQALVDALAAGLPEPEDDIALLAAQLT